ncbi:MAG: mandelate racemase/muconate lactonizing enzyme family protein [Pirellulales bacterium]
MKIERYSTYVLRVPFPGGAVPRASVTSLLAVELVVVELVTTDGVTGMGYTATIGVGGGAIKSVLDEPSIRELVLAEDPRDHEKIWNDFYWRTMFVGRNGIAIMALSALDVALWDLKARACGLPLWRLLGGFSRQIKGYGSGGYLGLTTDQLVAEMSGYVADGYRAVKMKIGNADPRRDVERVHAVRRAIGDDVELYVDANQVYDAKTAIEVARLLAADNIAWFEEPIPAGDWQGHAAVRQAIPMKLATGETLYTTEPFRDFIAREAVDVVQADASRLGGVTEWLKVAALARAWNLPMAPHFVLDIHLHLVAAVPNGLCVEAIFPWISPVVGQTVQPTDGVYTLSDAPGLGLHVSDEVKREYRVC